MIKFLDLKKINERFRVEMDMAAKRMFDENGIGLEDGEKYDRHG